MTTNPSTCISTLTDTHSQRVGSKVKLINSLNENSFLENKLQSALQLIKDRYRVECNVIIIGHTNNFVVKYIQYKDNVESKQHCASVSDCTD